MGLANAEVVCARAEEWRDGHRHASTSSPSRAVAPLNVLAEYAARCSSPAGTLVAYKGVRDAAEEADADGGRGAARASSSAGPAASTPSRAPITVTSTST